MHRIAAVRARASRPSTTAGRRSTNVALPPASTPRSTSPPWAWTMALTRLNPVPARAPSGSCRRGRAVPRCGAVRQAGMPDTGVPHHDRRHRLSRPARISIRPPERRVLDGVVDAGWRAPGAGGCDRRQPRAPAWARSSSVTPLVFGNVLVQLDGLRGRARSDSRGSRSQPHRAGLGLRDVHQRVEHRDDAFRFLQAVGQRFALRRGIVATAAPFRRCRAAASSASADRARRCRARRACRRRRVDAIEHRVEQRAELVERVAACSRTGTRASVRPVRRISRTASQLRTGCSAER